jgi:hypothetical protein
MLLRMVARAKSKHQVAARAWQLLFDFFASTRPERDRTLESRNLTANDSRALLSLDIDAGKTMGTRLASGAATLRMPRGSSIGSSGLGMLSGVPARLIDVQGWSCSHPRAPKRSPKSSKSLERHRRRS